MTYNYTTWTVAILEIIWYSESNLQYITLSIVDANIGVGVILPQQLGSVR